MQRMDPISVAEATMRADALPLSGPGTSRPAMPSMLDPLRPLRGTQPLDLGFELFRYQARVLVPLATLLYLPIQLLNLWLRFNTNDSTESSVLITSGFQFGAIGGSKGYETFILFAQSVALSILGICAGILVAAMLDGRNVSTGQAIIGSIRRGWVALSIVVMSALTYVALACVPGLGALIAGALTFTASVISGAEGLGPVRTMKRSFALGRAAMTMALGLFIGGFVLLTLSRLVLLAGPASLLGILGAPPALVDAVTAGSAILLIVIQPLTATLAAGAYIAFRTRTEGFDLQQRISSLTTPLSPGAR